ncbi:MAG: hypothetical protein IKH63_00990 [Prevotella sp.]|nr:hypothetical protein [Prevotella sp.]
MKKLFLLFSMMALAFNASADNYLTVDDVRVRPGDKANIVIKYHFESQLICAYQLDMQLGDGITPALEKADLDQFTNDVPSTFIVGVNEVGENHYRFATFSFGGNVGNEPITNAEGTLLTIQFTASPDLVSGTEIDATLFDVIAPENNGTQYNLSNVSFKIIIDDDALDTVLDEMSTVAPTAKTNANVKVLRTIKADQWSTICLPFAMTEAQVKEAFGTDVQIQNPQSVTFETLDDDPDYIYQINVGFSPVTAIEANHPYIIKTSDNISDFDVLHVNIAPNASPQVNVGNRRNKMYGNYVNGTTVPDLGLFLSDNKFWYSFGNTKIKGFRGYFVFDEYLTKLDEANSKVNIVFDGDATAIGNINKQNATEDIYSVSGMNVGKDASRLQRGVYIVNGKKVVKK